MRGLFFTSLIWSLLALGAFTMRHRRPWLRAWFTREHTALVLALLGTHSIVGSSDADEILSNPLAIERVLRGGLAGLALVLVLPLFIRRLERSERDHRSGVALMAYLGVAAASVIYSVAPLVSLAKVFELSAGVSAVVAIAMGPEPSVRLRRGIALLVALESVLLLVSVFGFFLLPEMFSVLQTRPGFLTENTMVAPFAHSNSLSAIGALTAAFSLAQLLVTTRPRQRIAWGAVFAIGTTGTLLASGRQGVAIWLASTAVLLFLYRRTAFFLLVIPLGVWLVLSYLEPIIGILSRGRPQNWATFTGRSYWWEAALEAWQQHPITGFGFGAGGRFVALGGSRSSVHSGYFEALVGLGLLGVLPLLYLIVRITRWTLRRLRAGVDVPYAILLIPLLLRTGVSLGFGAWLNHDFLVFALLALIADRSVLEQTKVRVPSRAPMPLSLR